MPEDFPAHLKAVVEEDHMDLVAETAERETEIPSNKKQTQTPSKKFKCKECGVGFTSMRGIK